LKNLGIDGRIILKWIFKKWIRGMGGTAVSQDKGTWQALVNAVNAGNFLSAFQEGLCSMEIDR